MELLELSGIVALIVVLIILIVVVSRAKKSKKTPAIEPEKPPVLISMGAHTAEKEEAEPEKEETESGKITIYTYTRSARVKVCAFCDGENDMTSAYCRICGKPIDG